MQKFVTVNRLSEITRADRRSVKKWLAIEGVEPANEGEKPARYDMERAVAAIAKHKDKRAKNDPNVDPKTGLTWFQLKTKAEALTKMRELKLAEAMDRKQLMKMEDYQEVMCIIFEGIEAMPDKIGSILGLTEEQKRTIQNVCDDFRKVTAGKIEEL